MKVLILGGGGNIGFWVEKLLIENNHYVYSIQRGFNKLKRSHLENQENLFIIREDINQLSKLSRELIKDCDLIVDFICFNSLTASERLILFSDFSGLFIMISTVAVYDRSLGANILSSVSSCEKVKWSYAKNKLEAEKVLLTGIKPGRIKICRLGHTFDPLIYSIAKAGVVGLTRSMAKRVGSEGLVNAISPGVIDTPMAKNYILNNLSNLEKQIPHKRVGTPMDVANLIYFLVSNQCTYITGQTINIDGRMINS